VVLLNAGDYFTGTLWYTVYGWKMVSYFLGQMKHTAMVIVKIVIFAKRWFPQVH
jgi:hypothetical protein